MPIRNLALGAVALLASAALDHTSHNTPKNHSAKVTHVVRKGETLDKIAAWTGTTKKQLIATNHLSAKKLKPGLVLHIPSASSGKSKHYDLSAGGYAPYTVRKNDTDWKIANMFHMEPELVRSLNPGIAWNHPKAGKQIRIPMRNAFIYKLSHIPIIRSRYAVVMRPDTIVRNAPGSNAKRVVKVDAGRHVQVLDRDTHWYKVRFEHGTEGWVRGDLLAAAETPVTLARSEPVRHKVHATMASYHVPVHRAGRNSRDAGFYAKLPKGGGDMISFAESMRGTPYRYGAASRSATDCSGYTLQVLRHEGVRMPRTAAEQSHVGVHVDGDHLKPGDLVFFHTSRGSRISHVGIYVGDGKFIHASSGGGKVQVNRLDEGYYKKRLATARRVVKVSKKHREESAEDRIAKSHKDDEAAMKAAERNLSDKVDK